jgi:Flp pilus assembly pilin Flp
MTLSFKALLRSNRGAGLVEFALIAPVLITFIIGIAQLGGLFFANAGLKSAVGEGARLATIFPRPTNEQIIARITSRRFGLEPTRVSEPTLAHGTTTNGRNYVDIEMTYTTPLSFIFFDTPPLTLVERRRAFIHACQASQIAARQTGCT